MTLLEIDEAWERVAAACPPPLAAEVVGLDDALGRVAAEDALSAVDLPPFDRSAMDGYAVRAADTAPGVPLRLAGGVAAQILAPRGVTYAGMRDALVDDLRDAG